MKYAPEGHATGTWVPELRSRPWTAPANSADGSEGRRSLAPGLCMGEGGGM